MTDLLDKTLQPTLAELGAYIGNPLFDTLCRFLERAYQPQCKIEFSGDSNLMGWNVKFRKAGRALCALYPKAGYFSVLVVVGRKEKERVEAVLPTLSAQMQALYHSTKEGMGQRWLMTDLYSEDCLYRDILTLIQIRRDSK